jgi:tetratricopeptide (TPR) repeat protein
MSADSFAWLHLTDFHYGLKGQDCLWPTLRQPFLESLGSLHDRCGPWDAVFFTGDLVQSGESAQFEKMQAEVLDPLWERLRELGSGDAVLLAVPGNHDLFRPSPVDDDPAVDRLLEKDGFERAEAKFWENPGGAYRRVVNNAFAAYTQWWNDAPHRAPGIRSGLLPGDFSATIERGDRRIGVVGLNTTFLQLGGGDYESRLVWDTRQLHAVCDEAVDAWSRRHDAALLLTHQGPAWLTPEARKQGESEIAPAGRFALHLFGHQHETEITYVSRGGAGNSVRRCQGCSVFGMEKFGEPPTTQRAHGYAAGRIEFGSPTVLRLWPRIATSKLGPWRFVPDYDHAVLRDEDQGTEPEPIAVHARAAAPPAGVPVVPAVPVPGGVSSPSPAAPHSTVPARMPFFGRGKDLERIARYLLPEDRSWGVVLDGPGGVGKTTLALEAAHRAPAEHFPLKLWITAKNRELLLHGEHRLTDHHVDDFHAMLAELGRALGRDDIPTAVPEDRPALVRHALAGHRALLVLDNLETFSAAQRRRVFELLSSLPAGCRAIVTSRRRTDGSTAAHHIRLDRLEREAADELLAELGRRLEPVARLTQEERDRLYAETGGNPLLLTWTAGQLGRTTGRCRTVDEAVERLQEAHRLQRLDEKNDPLDYVFGDLVETFTDDETAVLAALVHFAQPAPLEWLLPLTHLGSRAAETALDGLRDRTLLIEDDVAGTWLLPPLAARFLRRTRPEAVVASGERLSEHVSAMVLENGFSDYARFPVLESAWPQIAAALPVLLKGENRRLQIVCTALTRFLEYSGRWDDRITLCTAAETKAVHNRDFRNAGQRAYEVGWCYVLRGQGTEVLTWAERAAAHWEKGRAGSRELAKALYLRGLSYRLSMNFEAATTDFCESLALLRTLTETGNNVAVTLVGIADVLRRSGSYDDAETHYREALAIAKSLDDAEGVASCTGSLAQLGLVKQQVEHLST